MDTTGRRLHMREAHRQQPTVSPGQEAIVVYVQGPVVARWMICWRWRASACAPRSPDPGLTAACAATPALVKLGGVGDVGALRWA